MKLIMDGEKGLKQKIKRRRAVPKRKKLHLHVMLKER
jgi:hypothetical protein